MNLRRCLRVRCILVPQVDLVKSTSAHLASCVGCSPVLHKCPNGSGVPVQVTGKGPLTQFGLETGIPLGQASIGLVAFILFLLVAAVFEGNYGFNNTDDKSEY